MSELKVKFVSDEAKKFGLPIYRKPGDAGFDLHVILPEEDRENGMTIFPGERKLLSAGMHIELPEGYWALITHRSSTEKRLRLRVVQGVIDNQFRGRIFTQVSNDNTYPIIIEHGSRIAQMIILPIVNVNFVEVDELTPSERGEDGFGSTGK